MRFALLALLVMGCAADDEGPVGVNEVADGWLEIYSSDKEATPLDGWVLEDDGVELAVLGPDDVVEGGDVLYVELDLVGPATLDVFDADGTRLQQIAVPAMGEEQSFGRVPDGAPNWQLLDMPSPGALNGG